MNTRPSLFLLPSLLAVIFASGCGCAEEASSSSSESLAPTENQIYSAPATEKIRLLEDLNSQSVDLSISLCRGEKEGVQLIFKPSATCLYDVEVSPLSMGESVIPSDDVRIYREHYLNVTQTKEPDPVLGYYPDPLAPLSLSKEYGENVVTKGQNQAILIEVQSQRDTLPGLYEAEVKLTLGEESHTYPLKVEVEDVVMPKTHKAKRAFALWESEYSAAYQIDVGSGEYMRDASELLLDYGVSPTSLPEIAKLGLSEQVEEMATYAAREDVTCFSLPYSSRSYSVVGHGSYWTADFSVLEDLLRLLVEKSTDESNILAKCYLYITSLDEQKVADYWKVVDTNARLKEVKEALLSESALFEGKDEVKASLTSLEHVVTLTQSDLLYEDETEPGLYTACPLFSIFDNLDYLSSMKERQKAGNTYWWYGCTTPVSPYPTYHIDDDLLAAREVSWMQKQFGIEGELYWCCNVNSRFDAEHNIYLARDCWQDASTAHGSGDGWLIYPGNRYNTKESFPSLRLMAIRDGVEDYDLLCLLEEKFAAAQSKYGLSDSFDEYMKDIYSLILNGVHHSDSASSFALAKREVIALIKALDSGSNAFIKVTKNPKTNYSEIEVYANSGTSVSLNGTSLSSSSVSGGSYFAATMKTVAAPSASLSIANGTSNLTISKLVGGYADLVTSFEGSIAGVSVNPYQKEGIAASLNSLPEYAISGDSLQLDFSYVDRLSYRPTARLSLLDGAKPFDASSYCYLQTSIYNASDEVITLTVYLSDDVGSSESVAFEVLQPHSWTKLHCLLLLESIDSSLLSEIRFSFNNAKAARSVYLDDVAFQKGEE